MGVGLAKQKRGRLKIAFVGGKEFCQKRDLVGAVGFLKVFGGGRGFIGKKKKVKKGDQRGKKFFSFCVFRVFWNLGGPFFWSKPLFYF